MRRDAWTHATLLVLLGLQGCATPITERAGDRGATALMKALPRALEIQSANPHPCTAFPCTVPVAMHRSDVGGRPYCYAILPDPIQLPSPGGGPKTIVWKLDRASLPGGNLYFQPDHGILVLRDSGRQIMSCGPGNGQGGSDATEFHCKHRHGMSRAQTVYLPIIMQVDPVTGDIAMCGATDPRIVNGD